MKKLNFSYYVLMFITIFISVNAFYGGLMMLIDNTGKLLQMDQMLKYFEVLPFSKTLFQNYTFSGIALIIVNGITNLISFILLCKRKKQGIILGLIFGITLMLWILIQFVILPKNPLSITFFIIGLVQVIMGIISLIRFNQSLFVFDINDYPNINKSSKTLVVYFSRMGYTKSIAYSIANKIHANIYEVKTKEKIKGNLGFWWCGRFGLKHLEMEIENIDINVEDYDKVIICSPIWVFSISAPIRTFINKCAKKIKKVDYVFVHFMNAKFENVARDIDKILGIKHDNLYNYVQRTGKIKEI